MGPKGRSAGVARTPRGVQAADAPPTCASEQKDAKNGERSSERSSERRRLGGTHGERSSEPRGIPGKRPLQPAALKGIHIAGMAEAGEREAR